MRSAKWLLVAVAAVCGSLQAQSAEGDWQGTLKAGTGELRLVLHLSKTASGTLVGTLDSPDQATKGIAISEATLAGSKLNLSMPSIRASFEGTVGADGNSIAGTFTQGQARPLVFMRGVTAAPEVKRAKPSNIDGAWEGFIEVQNTKLNMVFHIVNTENGLTATSDVPAQHASGIPVTSVTRDGSTLKMEILAAGASFTGTISADRSTIAGTWSQNKAKLPLTLKRAKK